jgi:hypothetical protein
MHEPVSTSVASDKEEERINNSYLTDTISEK